MPSLIEIEQQTPDGRKLAIEIGGEWAARRELAGFVGHNRGVRACAALFQYLRAWKQPVGFRPYVPEHATLAGQMSPFAAGGACWEWLVAQGWEEPQIVALGLQIYNALLADLGPTVKGVKKAEVFTGAEEPTSSSPTESPPATASP